MPVVPSEEQSEFPAKLSLAQRYHDPARGLVFQSPDEAFDHGDAPMLPHGAEPWANSLAIAPELEGVAPEDTVLIADQVLGTSIDPSNHGSKKLASRKRVRTPGQHSKAHRTP